MFLCSTQVFPTSQISFQTRLFVLLETYRNQSVKTLYIVVWKVFWLNELLSQFQQTFSHFGHLNLNLNLNRLKSSIHKTLSCFQNDLCTFSFLSLSIALKGMFFIRFFTHCFRTTVYAPHGLSKIISATHHFMRFDTTKVQLHLEELKENSNTVYSDEEMKIHPITLTGVKSTVCLCCDRCSAVARKFLD